MRTPTTTTHWTHVAITVAVLLAFLNVSWALGRWTALDSVPEGTGDGAFYFRMAQDPFAFTNPPFGYRILVPLLVSLFPLSTSLGFYLLVMALLAATCALLYIFAHHFGISHETALMGVALFMLKVGNLYMDESAIYLVDPAVYVVLLITLLAALRGRPVLFAAALAIGALVKEAVLFGTLLWLAAPRPRAAIRTQVLQTILLSTPAFVVSSLLRLNGGSFFRLYAESVPRVIELHGGGGWSPS